MKIALIVATAAILSGCASSRPVMSPSGKQGFAVKCGSAALEACYDKAASVCPQGYTVVDSRGSGNGMLLPAGNAMMMSPGPHNMIIECK